MLQRLPGESTGLGFSSFIPTLGTSFNAFSLALPVVILQLRSKWQSLGHPFPDSDHVAHLHLTHCTVAHVALLQTRGIDSSCKQRLKVAELS